MTLPAATPPSRLEQLRGMREFIDKEIAAELGPALPKGRDNPTVRDVADLYGVTAEEILAGNRRHQVCRARHGVAWLLVRSGMSHRDAARILGFNTNGTVSYSVRKIDNDQAARALLLGLKAAS